MLGHAEPHDGRADPRHDLAAVVGPHASVPARPEPAGAGSRLVSPPGARAPRPAARRRAVPGRFGLAGAPVGHRPADRALPDHGGEGSGRRSAAGRRPPTPRRRAGARTHHARHRRVASRAPPAEDPFEGILAIVREAALSQSAHPAWSVLDRPRVQRLLTSHAVELDEMSRMYVWRLASAFLGL